MMFNILVIIIILMIFYMHNLQNIYFRDYIIETKNNFLLFLPLTHKYIYKNEKLIGFISKLFGCIIIAIYIEPKYRNQKIIKNYFENNTSDLVLTNNNKIINYLIKNKAKYIICMPYVHLFHFF